MREKTNLTLHPAVKEAASALAESQGRSLSELVERLLEREVEKNSSPVYGSFMREEPAQTLASQYSGGKPTVTYKAKSSNYKSKPAAKI